MGGGRPGRAAPMVCEEKRGMSNYKELTDSDTVTPLAALKN